MERYESYKDSGVKWIGEIPEHWEVRKSKYIWREREEVSSNGIETLLSVSQYNGVVPNTETSRSESLIGYKIVNNNNLVINIMLAWMGGLGISKHNGIVSPAYCVYETIINCDVRFLHYLYKTPLYLSEFARRSSGIVPSRWRMYTDDFGQVQTILPPKSEQTAIANYLDSVTSKIDEAISQQQKMIDLLNERKQIIIQNAVTKGLDPNAKMKDSGVEWIGEIPEDWELKRLKYSCKLVNNKTDDKLPYIELDNIESMSGKLISYSSNEPDSICTAFEEGDILFCKLRPYLAKCIITEIKGKCSSELLVLRDFLGVNKLLKYILLSPKYIEIINASTYGAKMPRANWSFIGNCLIPIPPKSEQTAIANYLDSTTSKIDSYISQCNKMISLLQERKQIIINDVVTGKVKVV